MPKFRIIKTLREAYPYEPQFRKWWQRDWRGCGNEPGSEGSACFRTFDEAKALLDLHRNGHEVVFEDGVEQAACDTTKGEDHHG